MKRYIFLIGIVTCWLLCNGCAARKREYVANKRLEPVCSERLKQIRFEQKYFDGITCEVKHHSPKFFPSLAKDIKTEDVVKDIWMNFGESFLNPAPLQTAGVQMPESGRFGLRTKDKMALLLSSLVNKPLELNYYQNYLLRDEGIQKWATMLKRKGLSVQGVTEPEMSSFPNPE